MTDRTIENSQKVGGDYFNLVKTERSSFHLQHHLDQFNIENYIIYKGSGKQRQVSIEDFYEFKYVSYILFKRELYNDNDIQEWIDFLYKFTSITFLNKPFPPKSMMKKIRVIQ